MCCRQVIKYYHLAAFIDLLEIDFRELGPGHCNASLQDVFLAQYKGV